MFKSKLFVIALTLVLAATAFFGASGANAAPGGQISVRISADKTAFTAGESALVNVTVSNTGRRPAKTLKWHTPYDDVEDSLFTVTRDGQPVAYLGAHYKHAAPTRADYVTLQPGESFTRAVDLGAYYDLSASGNYSIRYDVSAWNLFSEKGNAFRTESLASNKLDLAIEGRPNPAPAAITPDAVSGSTAFNKCNGSQQSALVSARNQASVYAADALAYLTVGTVGPRFSAWFGVYDPGRYTAAKYHFQTISEAMDTAPVTFDCSCKKKNVYAYVYANQPYTIYLCNVFWSAPLAGTDSKGGTLIHEMSHFNIVAATNDYAYGQGAAMNLAITDPNLALDNADNHEYFAENNPAQQ
ncbi:MAG: M35 family metallo-endopeptidase [Chloroflexota bacterium]